MLINKEWSEPKAVQWGKNIHLSFSATGFQVKVYNAAGASIQQEIFGDIRAKEIPFRDISIIQHPMISFRSTSEKEIHVSFEAK